MSETTLKPESEHGAEMFAKPQQEHRWLQKLVGEWTYEAADAGGSMTGGERVRTLGDLWVLCEGTGAMPDGDPATTLMTLGFNPDTKRFVGTWIGSMMTHLWIYDGELDASGRVLTLSAEGPSMQGDGTMARYQDVITIESDERRTLTARVQEADGTWKQFMKMVLRKVG
jgi:hypothetical protein